MRKKKESMMSATFLKKSILPLVLLAGFFTTVRADFYVIPITKKIEHVILVAKKGGDFTDVKAAIDSITDASKTNRYLVYVKPGTYTVTTPIQLKSWVTLMGSGENITLLKGAVSSTEIFDSWIISGGNDSCGIYSDDIDGGTPTCYDTVGNGNINATCGI